MPGKSDRKKLAHRRSGRRRGSAIVEFSLLAPWIFFLLLGAVDAGFMLYGLTTVENAARAGAIYASHIDLTDSTAVGKVCTGYVIPSLVYLGNIPGGLNTCGSTKTPAPATPVSVVVTSVAAGASPDTLGAAVTVKVFYLTPPLFPIFWGSGASPFPGQIIIARMVTVRHS
jgi:Flp pilus assembly protein TadG